MKRKHFSAISAHDDEIDALFRSALHKDLDVAAPKVTLPRPKDVAYDHDEHRRVRGGGPGGMACSGFYLLYYVMNSSRPAWGTIPG